MVQQGSKSTLALPPSYTRTPSDVILDSIDDKTNNANVNALMLRLPSELYAIPETKTEYKFEAKVSPRQARKPVLTRGLQVPTRFHSPTSKFGFPAILDRAGVDRLDWEAFTHEVNDHATLSGRQWASTVAGGASIFLITGIFIGWAGVFPAGIYGHRLRKEKEMMNIGYASGCGALRNCVDRWNKSYFNDRNLTVRVDIPGRGPDMSDMDLSTSKLYKHKERFGTGRNTFTPFTPPNANDPKLRKYQQKEGAARVRAVKKCRIVIMPFNPKAKIAKPAAEKPKIENHFSDIQSPRKPPIWG